MIAIDNEIDKSISELLEEETFRDAFNNALQHLLPSPKRRILLMAIFVLIWCTFFFSSGVFCIAIKNILTMLLPIIATLITMCFAGFAIFQAITSPEMIIIFLKHKSHNKSLLLDINSEYFAVFIMYLSLLIVGFCMYVFLNTIPEQWQWSKLPTIANTFFASTITSIYFTAFVDALFELKSFAFNLYQCYKITVICAIKRDK